MKVCFDLTPLATRSRFRGIGRYAEGLATALSHVAEPLQEGLQFYLLVGSGRTMRVVPLDGLSLARGLTPEGKPVSYQGHYASKRWRLWRLLRAANIDLFHAAEPKGMIPLPGIRTVVTCHDLIPTLWGPPYVPRFWPPQASRAMERYRYGLHDHVIAISDTTRRDLQRITGLANGRLSVIYHGIDRQFHPEPQPEDAAAVRALLGAERPFFLYVGGFDPRKQIVPMIEAFGRCAARIEETLVICGQRSASQRRTLSGLVRSLDLEKRVVFTDFVPSVEGLYRRATAHVMISTYEGFGFTVLEAMACGCPVIALNASSIPEVAGSAALLLESPDAETVSRALLRIASDVALRGQLKGKGLERAAQFSWSRCAEETVGVYQKVLLRGEDLP
jgi:glycosyltransferase involved in cell wall biosynthesis